MGGIEDELEQGVLEDVVSQVLLHSVPQSPLLCVWFSWGLSEVGLPLLLPSQVVLLLPGILCQLYLLCPGLADVKQHTSCDDDPGDVVLSDLKLGGEVVPAVLEMPEGSHHLYMGPAQAVAELGLVGRQCRST